MTLQKTIQSMSREQLESMVTQREAQLEKCQATKSIPTRTSIDDLIEWYRNTDRSLPIDEVGHAIDVFAVLIQERDSLKEQVAKLESCCGRQRAVLQECDLYFGSCSASIAKLVHAQLQDTNYRVDS